MADAEAVAVEAAKKSDDNGQGKTYPEEVVKELIAARDELKRKVREHDEAKKKSEESKLAEAGRLQELLDAKQKELAELTPLKEEVERYRKAEADHRETLLKQIPKDDREAFMDAPTKAIEKAVSLYVAAKVEPTGAAKPQTGGEPKDYEAMSDVERLELKASNYAAWSTLFSRWYEKRNGRKPPPQFLK